ncbi:MAG: A/G-specific adenine glycosylase [Pirellulales bacterium]|nr:A/G-specific adenine glycosylase [Pirellulales bacterium]
MPDARWRQRFRRRLRHWYTVHARDLPWRRAGHPYAVWVSEIMLQQTQAATVTAYFERFTRELPTIEALAQADEQDVLRLWEGLGYYRRARQLHRAAQVVMQQHAGELPRDPEQLRRLPGIGRYTAGAVLSIAFDMRVPILEANTLRLFSRLLALADDPAVASSQQLLWAMAEAVLPQRDVGAFNQALMELGSEVCLVRNPRCDDCPVAPLCRANARGLQAEIPPPKPQRPAEAVREAAVLICRRGRVLLMRCPEGQRWAGLWDFPRFPVRCTRPAALKRELAEKARKLTAMTIEPGRHLTTIKHGVTRFRITLEGYAAQYVAQLDGQADVAETKWLLPVELDDYPLSTTGRKLSRLVAEALRR